MNDDEDTLSFEEIVELIREAGRIRPDLFCPCGDHCPVCDPEFDWSKKLN